MELSTSCYEFRGQSKYDNVSAQLVIDNNNFEGHLKHFTCVFFNSLYIIRHLRVCYLCNTVILNPWKGHGTERV